MSFYAGVVEIADRENRVREKKQYEIDFVVNKGAKKYYIQPALDVSTPLKLEAERRPLRITIFSGKSLEARQWPRLGLMSIEHMGLYDFLLDAGFPGR